MHNSFFQAICRMGIFMICAQAMIHFRPQEAYEKYLKLLVSVMVLIQLFLPLGSFLLGGGGQEAAELLAQFKQELEQGMDAARESAEEADVLLQQMTLEEVRRLMEEQKSGEAAAGGEKEKMGEEESRIPEKQEDGNVQEKEGTREEGKDDVGADGQGTEENNGGYDGEADGIQVEIKPVEPVTIRNGE